MSAARRRVLLTSREQAVARDWQGGWGSMLQAAVSTGALRLGPLVGKLSAAEQWWDLTDRLMREAANAAKEASRRGLMKDASALEAIALKAGRAAKAAEVEVQQERSLGLGQGYTAEQAWKIAMAPGGSRSVIDLEGGGFAVPLQASTLKKRRAGQQMIVQVPRGFVRMAFLGSTWRVVGAASDPRSPAQLDREIVKALSSRRKPLSSRRKR